MGHVYSPPPEREQLLWLVKENQRLETEVERLEEKLRRQQRNCEMFHVDESIYDDEAQRLREELRSAHDALEMYEEGDSRHLREALDRAEEQCVLRPRCWEERDE